MTSVLDKVIAMHQLDLPYEIVETINEYCFYDEYQVKIKTLKNDVHRKFKYSFYGNDKSGIWWFSIAGNESEIHDKHFNGLNCTRCGNYIQSNNLLYIQNKITCICNMQMNNNQNEYYWDLLEDEIDPIQSEYDDFRYDYYLDRF